MEGIYDLTENHINKETSIVLISNKHDTTKIKILDYQKIKKILLERTGMGKSGESYIVGEDYHMRSQSRFFPDQIPYSLIVKTEGVVNALNGVDGKGTFKDYRGIDVYSVYGLIEVSNLKIVILSEIDVGEVIEPLNQLKSRLITLTLVILLIAVVLSLFLTRVIADPISNMQKSLRVMAKGDYNQNIMSSKNSKEIKDMFYALASLKASLRGAVKFSEDIGKMNLNVDYEPKSSDDLLGKSLITMRDKLKEFRNNEAYTKTMAKRMLVDGLENERRRLSRELHDGIGPYLTSLKHYIENKIKDTKRKSEMKQIVDDTISEIRLMSNSLMPSTIDDFGAGVALTNFVDSLNKSTVINIEYEDLTKRNHTKITNHQSINLFRISQELINNALKHSKAKQIRITLSEFDEFISLFYFDDGVGFDVDNVKLGSGIVNIKERVEICEGKIEINSRRGSTTFEIELPIQI
ncbi:sensor histidine kinase [Seonamhaeicola sp. ML3]|uniref:sensor histidine kinase n=1 Tax=Seonamhaeicola sp. ML3 TaxID=2937786 RepID=UPI00200DA2B9|nr:sensor histidine kinase [Seonamhaeicola sp. ML3]